MLTCAKCSNTTFEVHQGCICGCTDTREVAGKHCYSCGHVGTEESNRCALCNAEFNMQGVDHDECIIVMVCKDCYRTLTDPYIVAKCTACNKAHAEQLLWNRF